MFDLYALLPGFVLALIAIVVVSLISRERLNSQVAEQFDRMLAQR